MEVILAEVQSVDVEAKRIKTIEFLSSNWTALAGRFTGRNAARPSRRQKYSANDQAPRAAAIPLLEQRKHGNHRTTQSSRGFEFCPLERPPSLARLVICAHHFSGGLSKSACSAFPVGLGLFYIQCGSAIDHPKFPIRDAPPGVK
jgi:hypothetical protein